MGAKEKTRVARKVLMKPSVGKGAALEKMVRYLRHRAIKWQIRVGAHLFNFINCPLMVCLTTLITNTSSVY